MAKERILVVEDDVAIKQLLALMCLKADYTMIKASNGKEGIAALEANKNHFDLIISDIMMDEMNGFEFIKAVKSNLSWKTVPFIFFSGKTDAADRIMGLKLGADDYVTKPCTRDELALKVRILLEKNASIKKNTIAGLAGTFRNTSPRELLQILDITRKTGILVITSDTTSGALYFRNGFLINASIGEEWGEDCAVRLLCTNGAAFRFEPDPIVDIPKLITRNKDELLAYCNLNNTTAVETRVVDKDKRLIAIPEAISQIKPEEMGVFQLVSHNAGIVVSEVSKLFGEQSLNYISDMLERGCLMEAEPAQVPTVEEPPAPDVSPAYVPVSDFEELLDRVRQYKIKNGVSAIHLGLVGTRDDTHALLASLVDIGDGKADEIQFEQENKIIEIPDFTLIKLIFGEQEIYFHTMTSPFYQQFLCDAVYNNTAGTIVIDTPNMKDTTSKFVVTAKNKEHPCVVHNLDESELDFSAILNLVGRLIVV